jgi:hypothetical protein
MNLKRVFLWTVLALSTLSAFGLAILYVGVRPQLSQIQAFVIKYDIPLGLGQGAGVAFPSPVVAVQAAIVRVQAPSAYYPRVDGGYELILSYTPIGREMISEFEAIQSNAKQYWSGGGYFDESHQWQKANSLVLAVGKLASRTLLSYAPEEIGGAMSFRWGIAVILAFLGLALFVRLTAGFLWRQFRDGRWDSDRDGHDPTSDSGPESEYQHPESGTVTQGHREAAGKGWD